MRRLAALTTGVLTAATLVAAPALVGTSSAATARPATAHAVHAVKAKPAAKPVKPAEPAKPVVLVGVVAATPTVSTATTATSTVSLRVKHVSGTVAVLVDASTVVKRDNGRRSSRYELVLGDKVTVFARRVDGGLVATFVTASGRSSAHPAKAAAKTPVKAAQPKRSGH